MRRIAPLLILTLVLSALPLAGASADDVDAPVSDARQRALRIAQQLAEGPASQAMNPEREVEAPGEQAAPLAEDQQPLGSRSEQSITLKNEGGDKGWVLNTLTAMGIVLGLVFALRWCVRRFGRQIGARPTRVVEVLSRTSVAPRNHVVLLRVGGRVLVVGDSPQGLRTLSELVDPDEVASVLQSVSADRDDSLTRNFTKAMSRYTGQFDERDLAVEEGGDGGEVQTDRARDSVSKLLGRVRAMSGKGGAA